MFFIHRCDTPTTFWGWVGLTLYITACIIFFPILFIAAVIVIAYLPFFLIAVFPALTLIFIAVVPVLLAALPVLLIIWCLFCWIFHRDN